MQPGETAVGTPVGRILGVLLSAVLLGKAICGGVLLSSAGMVSGRSSFTAAAAPERNVSAGPRMCVCVNNTLTRMDPLGRLGGRGFLTSHRFCKRCWSAVDMASFRSRLGQGSMLIPLTVWLLATPLILLVLVPFLGNWPALQARAPSMAVQALGADVVVCLLMGAFCLDWGTFKSLCINGHAFDEKYQVEVPFADTLYFDVCAYSSVEERMTGSVGAVIALDLVAMTVIFYMRSTRLLHKPESRRTKGFLTRLGELTESARAVGAFDTMARRAMEVRRRDPVAPSLMGQRQADWGVGLSLLNFDGKPRKDRRDAEQHRSGLAGRSARGAQSSRAKQAPARQNRGRTAKERGANELFTYALNIAHTRGPVDYESDEEESLAGLEEAAMPELFHPPMARMRRARSGRRRQTGRQFR